MDTFNHVPANDYSSQNTIIIFKSCLELNFCQAGTSLAVDEGCDGFFLPPLPVEECEEGHLSFWKGSLFYKDHNMVCLTRPWPSDYLWCPHYVIHLVWLGEEEEEEEEREDEIRGCLSLLQPLFATVSTHLCWSDSMILSRPIEQHVRSISARRLGLTAKLCHFLLFACFYYLI